MEKREQTVQSELIRTRVSLRCPACHTLWLCYGLRERTFYTCKKCGCRFRQAYGKAQVEDEQPTSKFGVTSFQQYALAA